MVEKKRDILFDNIRVVLIILVVFGHVIEQIRFEDGIFVGIYNFIYLFHMPLFVFCSGAFAKSDKKRIIRKYLIPYVVFQTLYGIFDVYIMKAEKFHFLESYYVLWYILALAVWSLILPGFNTKGSWKKQTLLLGISMGVGLLAGYIDVVGKAFSLSRILVFFPFFLSGYYIKQEGFGKNVIAYVMAYKEKKGVPWLCVGILVVLGIGIYKCSPMINTWALYGYTSYAFQGYTVYFRIFQYMAGFSLGILIFMVIQGKKPLLPFVAKHSMGIYLSHVILIKLIEKIEFIKSFQVNTWGRFVYSFVFTCFIIAIGTGISEAAIIMKKWHLGKKNAGKGK